MQADHTATTYREHEAQFQALPAVDTTQRYVRVIEQRTDGLVAFEFAIGWPELACELLLPAPAFAAFCAANRVQMLDAPDSQDA